MRLSIGKDGATESTIKYIIHDSLTEDASLKELLTLERLEASIVDAVKRNKEMILTWLNPKVTVTNVNGNKVPAVAIMASMVDSFANLSHAKLSQMPKLLAFISMRHQKEQWET
ncbi:uncharacterized protein [Montipora capricornis]|uniref:uncharacterized protein isoform X1 n=1 Tax=Montipora capricornis TaxID=246305 RepID=UPI0035F13372